MKRLFAPLQIATYLASEWIWQPLWDRLSKMDERLARIEDERIRSGEGL